MALNTLLLKSVSIGSCSGVIECVFLLNPVSALTHYCSIKDTDPMYVRVFVC